jgi:hypothetical protein
MCLPRVIFREGCVPENGAGLQPCPLSRRETWGVALGYDGTGPLAFGQRERLCSSFHGSPWGQLFTEISLIPHFQPWNEMRWSVSSQPVW